LAADPQDNLYLAGELEGETLLDGEQLDLEMSGARVMALLASIGTAGEPRWSHVMGRLNEHRVDALRSTADGVLLGLGFSNFFQVAGLDVEEFTNGAAALLAFATNGAGRWATIVHNAPDWPYEPVTAPAVIEVSPESLVMAGGHRHPIRLRGLDVTLPEGNSTAYFASLSSSGVALALKTLGDDQRYHAAAALGSGSILVGERMGAADSDIALTWLDSDGNVLLSKTYGSAGDDAALAVVALEDDSVAVAGYVSGAASLGCEDLGHVGLRDLFIASYGAGGECRWSRSFGSRSDDRGVALRQASDGRLLLAGMHGDAIDFGTGAVGSFGEAFLLAALTEQGVVEWAQSFAMNAGEVTDLVALSGGALAVAGFWNGALKLPAETLSSRDDIDGFVLHLKQQP
jgi:hypothetical protein